MTFHQLGRSHQGRPEKKKQKRKKLKKKKEANQIDQITESCAESSQTAEIWKGAIC